MAAPKRLPPAAPAKAAGAPVRLPGALGELARAAGGTARLAALLGVHPTTVQNWAKVIPPKPARRLLALLAAEYGLTRKAQNELARFNA